MKERGNYDNFPNMKVGLETGFERIVVMVFDSISSFTAPVAENIAMNKPAKNSVESPISRKNLISSSSEYITMEGLIRNISSAEAIITA